MAAHRLMRAAVDVDDDGVLFLRVESVRTKNGGSKSHRFPPIFSIVIWGLNEGSSATDGSLPICLNANGLLPIVSVLKDPGLRH